MEENIEAMKEAGIRVIHVLDECDLDLCEQLMVLEMVKDAVAKNLVFNVVFGDEADEMLEKLMKADAAEAVEEAEEILKEEK